ncbi:MAG: polyamine aminopropyltransferase [Chloroflexi bacterium]|nr:polyamine aminopropyltransferase [Chloroflexota bacterium]
MGRIDQDKREVGALFTSILVIAVCGLLYELLVGSISTYLLGNSIYQFSITIGLFMTAMGLGSYLSKRLRGDLLTQFMVVEIAIGLVGGTSAAALFAIFSTLKEVYKLVMVIIIVTVGTLIGLEIPLVARIAKRYGTLRDTLANVLSFDYLGALVASVAFPLILLPNFGLLKTAFLTGLFNLAVVALNLQVFWRTLRTRWPLALATASSAGLLLAGFFYSLQLTSLFEHRLYQDEILYTQQTPYQRIVITKWKDDLRLFLDGNLQFSSTDEYRYHESLVHPALSLARSREDILILGGGDGLIAREMLKYPDVRNVTLVDIDREMTSLAARYPLLAELNQGSLQDHRVRIVNQDAYKYLEETSGLYQAIIIDLPDPRNENLAKLYSREFYGLAARHLAAGGMLATQAASPYFVRKAYWSVVHTLRDVGLYVKPYHVYVPSFGDWGFALASNVEPDVENVRISVPVRFLSSSVLKGMFSFDADIAEVPVAVNTLNESPLLWYYLEGWAKWHPR